MSDERWRLIEEAFGKIQPKDDAEREKLVKLKERMRAHSTDSAGILARHQTEQGANKAEGEEAQRRLREQSAIAEATRDALLAGIDEQADLIEGIARQTAR